MFRTVLLLFAGAFCSVLAAAQKSNDKKDQRSQYERMLEGADAQKAAILQKRVADLEAMGKRGQALKAAEELLDLRQKLQGEDHFQTVNARFAVANLRQPRTPEEARDLAEAVRHNARALTLKRQGKSNEAIPVAQTVIKVRSRLLGEKHPDTATRHQQPGSACTRTRAGTSRPSPFTATPSRSAGKPWARSTRPPL